MKNQSEMERLLPHRFPFLYVDSLGEVSEERIVGFRTYMEEEPFFQGHFPGYPVVPGVLLVEALAQCGGAGLKKMGVMAGEALFFLATIEKAKFRRQVRPGEAVRMEITNDHIGGRMIKQRGKSLVEGCVAAEASWMCLVGERK